MLKIKEIKEKYNKKINLLDIELIISRVIKKSREFVLAHPEHKPTPFQISKIKKQISRRINNEPLAYIFGEKEFYGLNFKVNKNTLVPRPETELIIDEALDIAKNNPQPTTFIDIGTGSGCIIITLAKNLNKKFFAIDISRLALRVARQNAKLNKVNNKIKFIHGNLLAPILDKLKKNYKPSRLVITANLPYLTPNQIKNSPSIQQEPNLALEAGKDGLLYYRQLLKQIKSLDLSCHVLCEIDPSQKNTITNLIKNIFPNSNIKTKKDLRGLYRLAIIKIK